MRNVSLHILGVVQLLDSPSHVGRTKELVPFFSWGCVTAILYYSLSISPFFSFPSLSLSFSSLSVEFWPGVVFSLCSLLRFWLEARRAAAHPQSQCAGIRWIGLWEGSSLCSICSGNWVEWCLWWMNTFVIMSDEGERSLRCWVRLYLTHSDFTAWP